MQQLRKTAAHVGDGEAGDENTDDDDAKSFQSVGLSFFFEF